MKAFVVLALVIGASFGAPTENIGDLQRVKKGAYGAPPCAAAAPVALYLGAGPSAIPATGFAIPNYREDEQVRENNDNLHHGHQARSYYDGLPSAASMISGASASAAAAIAAANAAAASSAGPAAPAVGVFPGAKIGGCAVPLLLSCAPSVHSGHLAHTAYGAPIAAPAYRTGADQATKMRETTPEKQKKENEHAPQMRESWAEVERSSQMREPLKNWSEAERSTQMREMAPLKNWSEAERSTQTREMAPLKNWSEAERSTQMREMAPLKNWSEAERASQMRAMFPRKNWSESARGAELAPMHQELHHHHVPGDNHSLNFA